MATTVSSFCSRGPTCPTYYLLHTSTCVYLTRGLSFTSSSPPHHHLPPSPRLAISDKDPPTCCRLQSDCASLDIYLRIPSVHPFAGIDSPEFSYPHSSLLHQDIDIVRGHKMTGGGMMDAMTVFTRWSRTGLTTRP